MWVYDTCPCGNTAGCQCLRCHPNPKSITWSRLAVTADARDVISIYLSTLSLDQRREGCAYAARIQSEFAQHGTASAPSRSSFESALYGWKGVILSRSPFSAGCPTISPKREREREIPPRYSMWSGCPIPPPFGDGPERWGGVPWNLQFPTSASAQPSGGDYRP